MKVDNTQPWPYLNEALAKFQVSTSFALSCDRISCRYFLRCKTFSFFYSPYADNEVVVSLFFFFSICQDPTEADKLLRIQRGLDETKIILVSLKLNALA